MMMVLYILGIAFFLKILWISDRDYDEKTPEPTISKQEQLRMIHLRSHLNQLTEKVKHHQYLTEKTRYLIFVLDILILVYIYLPNL